MNCSLLKITGIEGIPFQDGDTMSLNIRFAKVLISPNTIPINYRQISFNLDLNFNLLDDSSWILLSWLSINKS